MGIPLLSGRGITARDEQVLPAPRDGRTGWRSSTRRSQSGTSRARTRLAGTSASASDPGTPMPIEIVGLMKDTTYAAVREERQPQIYFSYLQSGDCQRGERVRAHRDDPAAVMPLIRREFAAMDPQLAIYGVATFDDLVGRSVVNERLIATLSTTLGAMATLLSIVGLYGVMAYMVTRRTREIGIRMALGAVSRQIAGGVMRESALLVAVGLVVARWPRGRSAATCAASCTA